MQKLFVIITCHGQSTQKITPMFGVVQPCAACKTPNVSEEGQAQEHHDTVDLLEQQRKDWGFGIRDEGNIGWVATLG